MALATKQNLLIEGDSSISQPVRLLLSTSVEIDCTLWDSYFPQYLAGAAGGVLRSPPLPEIFSFFRKAGPIAQLHPDSRIMDGPSVCVVRYFTREDARAANDLVAEGPWPGAEGLLHEFDPKTLVLTVRLLA